MIAMERGNFAWICVKMDLNKPQRPSVELLGKLYHIKYEGINLVCFSCSLFGHRKE